MDRIGNEISQDSSLLVRILEDLNFYTNMFSQQRDRLACCVLINKNVVDVQNCLIIIKKHRSQLLLLINASCEEGILDDSDDEDDDDDDDRGDGGGDGDGKDEVDNMAEDSGEDSEMDSEGEKSDEASSGKRRSRKAILDWLSFPEYHPDVKLILSTFDCRIRDRRTLSTVDSQSS